VIASLPARRTVVCATNNKHKLRELRQIFAELPIDLVTVTDVAKHAIEVVEDRETFEGNARKKAREVAEALAMPALADDSGLEVDALLGAPGVRSARYSGEHATDAENNRKLLHELDSLSGVPRNARFRCVLVLHDPIAPKDPIVAEGGCEGEIAGNPRGALGFGYDPIFVVKELPGRRTMAELSDHEKNSISHRARAAKAMAPKLRRWLGLD
jgi:XTP/dITP diphosphohydrolase